MRQHNTTDICFFLVWSRGVTSSLDYYVYLLNITSYYIRYERSTLAIYRISDAGLMSIMIKFR